MKSCYLIKTQWADTEVLWAELSQMALGRLVLVERFEGPTAYQRALGQANELLRERGEDFRKWAKGIGSKTMTARSVVFDLHRYEEAGWSLTE